MAEMTLTEADKAKLAEWTASLGQERPDPLAYLDYFFTNSSGIGLSVEVTDRLTGKKFDLTDYDAW